MRFYNYLILTFSIVFLACECPPSAQTPKKLTPFKYANICVLNVVHNTYSINVDTKYGEIIDLLHFKQYSNYVKIGSGNNFINLKHNIFEFYKVFAFFETNAYYTFIPSGNADQVQATLIKDPIESLDINKAYIRVINLSNYIPELEISNSLLPKTKYKFRDITQFIEYQNNQELFKYYIDDDLIYNLEIFPKAGTVYTIVSFYNPTEKNKYGLAIAIVEQNIPD